VDSADNLAGRVYNGRLRLSRPAVIEYGLATLASAAAVAILWYRTDLKTMGTAAFADPGWDRHLYIELARRAPFDFRLAPYCWRVLAPWLAKALPLGLQASFQTVTVVALVAGGLAVYALIRAVGFSKTHGALALLLLFGIGWGPKFQVSDFWVPDATAFAFTVVALLLAARRQLVAVAVVMAAGVLAKESVLFVAPLVYTLSARRLFDRRWLLKAALAAIPALAVVSGIRIAIPQDNGNAAYIATMPPVISRFPELFGEYSYSERFDSIAREQRWEHREWTDWDRYFTDPFGALLLGLAVAGTVRTPILAAKLAPYLVLVYSQLLFATDTQRLLVLAFPALAWLAVEGADELRERVGLAPAVLVPLAAALFALVLRYPAGYGRSVWLEALLVVVYVPLAVAGGRRCPSLRPASPPAP
jgi:hypothetical protein